MLISKNLIWSHRNFGLHRSYCGIIPTFVGKQIFAGSWGHYFVGKLCDVTREDISKFICFSKYGKSYLSHILLGKITLFGSYGSLCKHFDASSNCGEVKPSKELSNALDCKINDRNQNKKKCAIKVDLFEDS